MTRLPGWRKRLADVLLQAAGTSFEWGQRDCCLGLAAPAVQAVTGQDLGEPYRYRYSSALGALRALKEDGFNDLTELAAAHFARIPVSAACHGDLAAIQAPDTGWALGVVLGPRIAVLSPQGYATIDLLKADHCYRVG